MHNQAEPPCVIAGIARGPNVAQSDEIDDEEIERRHARDIPAHAVAALEDLLRCVIANLDRGSSGQTGKRETIK